MAIATLTSKGQTTIPKEIRDRLKLKPGDRLDFTFQADGSVRLTARNLRIKDLYGILAPSPRKRPMTIEEMNEAIIDAAVENDRRVVADRRGLPSAKKSSGRR